MPELPDLLFENNLASYVYNIRIAYIGVHTTYIRTFVHEKMTMYEIFLLDSIVAHGLLDFTE